MSSALCYHESKSLEAASAVSGLQQSDRHEVSNVAKPVEDPVESISSYIADDSLDSTQHKTPFLLPLRTNQAPT